MRRRIAIMAVSLVAVLSGAVWAVGGFFPSNPAVYSSISYSGSGPHIKNAGFSSTMTVDTSVTLMGGKSTGSPLRDIAVLPTNSSRVGPVFEVQDSTGTAEVQVYDTGRVFAMSAINFPLLARATSTNASGFEVRDSGDVTVGVLGFAGGNNQAVTASVAGDLVMTLGTALLIGKAVDGKHGTRTITSTRQTLDSATYTCGILTEDDNTVYIANYFVVGRRTDIAGRSIHQRRVGSFRDGGNVTFITGSPSTPFADQSSGTVTNLVGASAVGNELRINVTNLDGGGAAVEWTCTIFVEAIATG